MKILGLMLLLLIMSVPVSLAQDDIDNLLELLNTVPDIPEAQQYPITFVDYKNVIRARDGVRQFTEYEQIYLVSDEERKIFEAAIRSIISGPHLRILDYAPAWSNYSGYDFMDINRSITYGIPPQRVEILVGDFDMSSISSQYEESGYSYSEFGDITLLCPEYGCEVSNPPNYNWEDPLGGQYAFLLSEQMIVQSPIYENLALIDNIAQDEMNSLADNSMIRAAVSPIDPNNIVIQGKLLYPPNIILNVSNLWDDELNQLKESLEASDALPQWDIVLMTDTATSSEQVVYASFVYSDLESAQTSARIVEERLNTMASRTTGEIYATTFAGLGVDNISSRVVSDEANSHHMAVIELRAPLAENIELENGNFMTSSMVYLMVDYMVMIGDTIWLTTETADQLEN